MADETVDPNEPIQIAVRCKHETGGKPCNNPLLKLMVSGIAEIKVTCSACRRASRVLWQPLGVKVELVAK